MFPVFFEGIDKVGSELLGGLRMWVEWTGEKSGREEVKKLAETAGGEVCRDGGTTFIWKPTFLLLQARHGRTVDLGVRGNVLVE